MPLQQRVYTRGEIIPDPVYLDANILISYFVPERQKPSVLNIINDLLIQKAKIVLSWVDYHELIWGLLNHIYIRERQKREPQWKLSPLTMRDFNQHKQWFLPIAEKELEIVPEVLKGWGNISIFPSTEFGWEISLRKLLETLFQHYLAPSDTAHLVMAMLYARSFVTEDPDFVSLRRFNEDPDLFIYII